MSESSGNPTRPKKAADHFLKPRRESTPCVGICSTSHGDYVCRGCKRFFNEVRDWLAFSADQREMVLDRLGRLKRESIHAIVEIEDAARLKSKTDSFVPEGNDDFALRIYEALARCKGSYADWGLSTPTGIEGGEDPIVVLKAIEEDYYLRSRGTFEQIYSRPSR